jgi:hypothetical protein
LCRVFWDTVFWTFAQAGFKQQSCWSLPLE